MSRLPVPGARELDMIGGMLASGAGSALLIGLGWYALFVLIGVVVLLVVRRRSRRDRR